MHYWEIDRGKKSPAPGSNQTNDLLSFCSQGVRSTSALQSLPMNEKCSIRKKKTNLIGLALRLSRNDLSGLDLGHRGSGWNRIEINPVRREGVQDKLRTNIGWRSCYNFLNKNPNLPAQNTSGITTSLGLRAKLDFQSPLLWTRWVWSVASVHWLSGAAQ